MAPVTRAMGAREASSADRLPAEMLSAILQLLPAKDLCRLRAVCTSWRSLTSDADFIGGHADIHKEPLFLAKFRDDDEHVYVVDLSRNVVKRIVVTDDDGDHQLQVHSARPSLACLATEWSTCCVLDPATGRSIRVRWAIPRVCISYRGPFFTLGLVASKGEYKLLRLIGHLGDGGVSLLWEVDVLTISGGNGITETDVRFRERPGPRSRTIEPRSGVVLDGVVYFLTHGSFSIITSIVINDSGRLPIYHILSFDLDTEEWRRDLPGPSAADTHASFTVLLQTDLTQADMRCYLVLAHHYPYHPSIMDLFFLHDFESQLWVRHYSIQTEPITANLATPPRYHLIPLLALDDGRLVFHLAPPGLLFICDPRTNTFTQVDLRHRVDSVSVYKGSLLGLQQGNMVLLSG